MKVLVIGSGGREHAIAYMLSKSDKVSEIIAAPGNGGTMLEKKTSNLSIQADDIDGLLNFAKTGGIDFTVVGPEIPLADGIVDRFEQEGLRIFGPNKEAARLEYSKAFAKEIMQASGVPTAKYMKFTDFSEAEKYIREEGAPIVVKADGLAAGKGVVVASTVEEAVKAADDILNSNIFGSAGASIVVEEFLQGEELSFLSITDGKTIIPLSTAQDHKAVFDGDKGPNTGGMGAYSPAFMLSDDEEKSLVDLVSRPIIEELAKRGIIFKGVLYAGLMVSKDAGGKMKVNVLEYNVRFGDPETQVILPRLKTDLFDLLYACSEGRLDSIESLCWSSEPAVTVVMASGGYPGSFKKDFHIKGIEDADNIPGIKVFHAGTVMGCTYPITAGGRVLNVTAMGRDLKSAIDSAYEAIKKIQFENAHYRTDIGAKALKRMK